MGRVGVDSDVGFGGRGFPCCSSSLRSWCGVTNFFEVLLNSRGPNAGEV
jgi:hypothetical protein